MHRKTKLKTVQEITQNRQEEALYQYVKRIDDEAINSTTLTLSSKTTQHTRISLCTGNNEYR